jgi:hypothetical protein
MMLTTVNSNAIHAIGYDPKTRQLEVIFTGGGIYLFQNVPQDVFLQFLRSPSKGSFFRRRIQGRFRQERLGRLTKRQEARRQAKHPPTAEATVEATQAVVANEHPPASAPPTAAVLAEQSIVPRPAVRRTARVVPMSA